MIQIPSSLTLKLGPFLHDDVRRVKFSLLVSMVTFPLTSDLSRLTPREIVEMPECVCGQDKVPNGEGKEIDEHPANVGDFARGDDDEETGQTKDDGKKDERNDGVPRTLNDRFDDEV